MTLQSTVSLSIPQDKQVLPNNVFDLHSVPITRIAFNINLIIILFKTFDEQLSDWYFFYFHVEHLIDHCHWINEDFQKPSKIHLGWYLMIFNHIPHLIARFMGPTWGPSGADRTQVGPMNLAIWVSPLRLPPTYPPLINTWWVSEFIYI